VCVHRKKKLTVDTSVLPQEIVVDVGRSGEGCTHCGFSFGFNGEWTDDSGVL
jgi:hypothetical protein